MRTTLTIDDELYQAVQEELGTHSTGETIRAAFERVAAERRRRLVAESLDVLGEALTRPDALEGAWR